MAQPFDHTVLIVDDEVPIGNALVRLMKAAGISSEYAESGPEALDRMKKRSQPFSLIISDQKMPEMDGADFFEQARDISPDTIRFLMTGYSDMMTISEAVNKGAIHRYLAKPWDNRLLIEDVRAGLEQYELIMDNRRLFALAKEQNAKLLKLNTDLKKKYEAHQNAIFKKDQIIAALKAGLEKGSTPLPVEQRIASRLKDGHLLGRTELNAFYADLMAEVFLHFTKIAGGMGFDLPETMPGE